MEEFFKVGGAGYYLLILVFAACIVALLMLRNNKKRPATKAQSLQERYAVMTKELLDATPDEELVNAVAANLMGKLSSRRPDPLITIVHLSHGRNAVYFTWMLVKEVEHNGVEALLKKPASRFVDVGVEGLITVGAEQTAAAVRAFVAQTEQDGEASPAEQLLLAMETEQPLSLCVDYIRDNPDDFLDQ